MKNLFLAHDLATHFALIKCVKDAMQMVTYFMVT